MQMHALTVAALVATVIATEAACNHVEEAVVIRVVKFARCRVRQFLQAVSLALMLVTLLRVVKDVVLHAMLR